MRSAKCERTRIAAAKELLDRGYGKAPQAITGDPENPLVIVEECRKSIAAKMEAARRAVRGKAEENGED